MVHNTEVTQEVQYVWELSDKLAAGNLVIAFFMLLVTGVSVCCAFKVFHHQKSRAKKDAACDLAREYADTILTEYQFVLNVFGRAELDVFVKKVFPMDKFDSFSAQEMSKLAQRAKITPDELKAKMTRVDPLIILDALIQETPSVQERVLLQTSYSKIDEHTGKRVVIDGNLLQHKFVTKVLSLANKLEWFAMKCRYGLADEKLLYQSLHQTYLAMVWLMYYFISRHNTNINDKFYTNTIWLFKTWSNRLKEQNKTTELETEAAIKKIQEGQKQLENIGHEYTGKPLY